MSDTLPKSTKDMSPEEMATFMAHINGPQAEPQVAVQPQNPLQAYFRHPELYMTLPSGGRWYRPGALDMPENGEIEVFPMTAKDEILLKTPDTLLNGKATMNVIKSCIPSIKQPEHIPAVDIDTVLISIRIASYGEEMDVDSECHHCGYSNTHGIDLRNMIDGIRCPDYTQPLIMEDGLQVFFKPTSYGESNLANMEKFEEERLIAAITSSETTEEDKMIQFNRSFEILTDLTLRLTLDSISHMTTPDGAEVVDRGFIQSFLENCGSTGFALIKDRIKEYKDIIEMKPLMMVCGNPELDETAEEENTLVCNKQYETPLVFDQSHFFG